MNHQMDEEFARGANSPTQEEEYFGYEKEPEKRPTKVSQFYQN